MGELEVAPSPFAPTTFWRPAVRQLIDDLSSKGIEQFKSWRSAQQFFYPRYGQGFNSSTLADVANYAVSTNSRSTTAWVSSRLSGSLDAHRDMDVALAMIDRSVMDYDLLAHGESDVGGPPQHYRLSGNDWPRYGRPYLNYLRILSALSTVVDSPPRSYLEIGGGFGVLGEILGQHEQGVSYVNVDIPPLVSIAGWYLDHVFTSRDVIRPRFGSIPPAGDNRWRAGVIASIPSWRLGDVPCGEIDVFVNSFSFQEMEPQTVAEYVEILTGIAPAFVVSLNSRSGKPVATADREVGVKVPTTSKMIEKMFAHAGYSLAAAFGRPAAPPQAELVILKRTSS